MLVTIRRHSEEHHGSELTLVLTASEVKVVDAQGGSLISMAPRDVAARFFVPGLTPDTPRFALLMPGDGKLEFDVSPDGLAEIQTYAARHFGTRAGNLAGAANNQTRAWTSAALTYSRVQAAVFQRPSPWPVSVVVYGCLLTAGAAWLLLYLVTTGSESLARFYDQHQQALHYIQGPELRRLLLVAAVAFSAFAWTLFRGYRLARVLLLLFLPLAILFLRLRFDCSAAVLGWSLAWFAVCAIALNLRPARVFFGVAAELAKEPDPEPAEVATAAIQAATVDAPAPTVPLPPAQARMPIPPPPSRPAAVPDLEASLGDARTLAPATAAAAPPTPTAWDASLGAAATLAPAADASLGHAVTSAPPGVTRVPPAPSPAHAGRTAPVPVQGLGCLDKRYLLKQKLGEGSFGAVYAAVDSVTNLDVAVKALPPHVTRDATSLEAVRANFALISRLAHPNIAALRHLLHIAEVTPGELGACPIVPGDYVVVMDLVPGKTLREFRKQQPQGRLDLPTVLELAPQLASALDYAHSQGIIHRDVKPGNIMVTPDRQVKLLDFGLAAEVRLRGDAQARPRDIAGTRPYMAPEQWAGMPQGPATDQYAMAVVLYELLAGEVPMAELFRTAAPLQLPDLIQSTAPAPIAGFREKTNRVLRRALSKSGASRFDCCMELAATLMASQRFEATDYLTEAQVAMLAASGIADAQWPAFVDGLPPPPPTAGAEPPGYTDASIRTGIQAWRKAARQHQLRLWLQPAAAGACALVALGMLYAWWTWDRGPLRESPVTAPIYRGEAPAKSARCYLALVSGRDAPSSMPETSLRRAYLGNTITCVASFGGMRDGAHSLQFKAISPTGEAITGNAFDMPGLEASRFAYWSFPLRAAYARPGEWLVELHINGVKAAETSFRVATGRRWAWLLAMPFALTGAGLWLRRPQAAS